MPLAPPTVRIRDLPFTDLTFLAALLERRFPHLSVTPVGGGVAVGDMMYRMAPEPSVDDVAACAGYVGAGRQVVLLVLDGRAEYARGMAAVFGIESRLNIWGAEPYGTQILYYLATIGGTSPEAVAARCAAPLAEGTKRHGEQERGAEDQPPVDVSPAAVSRSARLWRDLR